MILLPCRATMDHDGGMLGPGDVARHLEPTSLVKEISAMSRPVHLGLDGCFKVLWPACRMSLT